MKTSVLFLGIISVLFLVLGIVGVLAPFLLNYIFGDVTPHMNKGIFEEGIVALILGAILSIVYIFITVLNRSYIPSEK